MCDLYSITTNQEAIRAVFRVMNPYVGNLPSMPGVFPASTQFAPFPLKLAFRQRVSSCSIAP